MTNIFDDFLEVILCTYAVVKHISGKNFPKCDAENFGIFEFICELLRITISLILYMLIALFLFPFVVLRKAIDVYLRMKHGSRYYGLLRNMDAMWTGESSEAKHIINTVFFVELKKSPQEFLINLRRKTKEIGNIRFNSTLHHMLNYCYRLRSDEIADNVMRLVSLAPNETISKAKFEEKISDLANRPLPKSSAYEVLISAEPIKFSEGNNTHVLIIRFHHSIGDGVSLFSFLLKMGNREGHINQITDKLLPANKHSNTEFGKAIAINCEKKYATYLDQLISVVKNTSLYRLDLLEPPDNNILHGPRLTGEKVLVFDIESEPKYMPKIKSVKKQIEDCKFTDILYTAVSASLCEYFSQHTQDIPKNLNMSFISTYPKVQIDEDGQVRNSFCAITLDIPVLIEGSTSPAENLIFRLKTIKARSKILQQSMDSLLFYWLCRHISLLPIFLLKMICKMGMKTTLSFSNLPGIKFTKLDDQEVKNIVFYTPNVANVGIGLTILSYNDRLQIGLIADKVVIPKGEIASAIVKNIYKYLDLLAEEVKVKK